MNKSRTRGRANLAVVMPLRPMTVMALSIDLFSAISFVEGWMSSILTFDTCHFRSFDQAVAPTVHFSSHTYPLPL